MASTYKCIQLLSLLVILRLRHFSPYKLFFFSSRRRHTRLQGDWSSDVCSSDLVSFTSLSLLMLTSTVTLVSTGKLDVITSFAAPLILLYKGFRSWHGRPAELSPR